MSDDGRVTISFTEACKLLPAGNSIHTFREAGSGVLLGADWPRLDIVKALKDAEEIDVTGEQAQAMGHGLAILGRGGPLFIEARKGEAVQSEG